MRTLTLAAVLALLAGAAVAQQQTFRNLAGPVSEHGALSGDEVDALLA